MTALKPEHLQLATAFDGAKPAGPSTPLRRSGGFFQRNRRPSATSSTVSSTPTFFSSTRSRQSHFPGLSPSESTTCGCPCRHHETAVAREAETLLCCFSLLLRRRAEPERDRCCCADDCRLALPRATSARSLRPCMLDSSATNSGSSSGVGLRHEEDFALLDLRPPPLPPRRRHHSVGSALAWVHPGGPPRPPPPRPLTFVPLPRCLAAVHRCPFYWGRMDGRRAEAVLAATRSGTFLLRDSSHGDYLFTLSYRWAGAIKHLRVEAAGHQLFALDASSQFVFDCPIELINFYRDRRIHLVGTALLLQPLNRRSPFSLSALCRATVCSRVARSADLDQLHLPPTLVAYLRYYCQPLIPMTRPKPPHPHPR